MKACPACEFLVPPEAESCNFCGFDFEAARVEAEAAAAQARDEAEAQRLREEAEANGIGFFSTKRVVRPGEEHLEEPVHRAVVAGVALVGLLLLAGVGWWITRSSDTTTTKSSTTPTVAVYVPPTSTVVAYSALTTQPPVTIAPPACTKKCAKATTTTSPVDPHSVTLGPIVVTMPGTVTTSPPAGSTLSANPLVAESTISAGHFARVTIQSADTSKPEAVNSVITAYAKANAVPLTSASPTSALGGLPAFDFELGTNQAHHGLAVMGPGFVALLDVWRSDAVGNADDASAYVQLTSSLAAAG